MAHRHGLLNAEQTTLLRQWFTPQAFREAHLATRDELLQRLGA